MSEFNGESTLATRIEADVTLVGRPPQGWERVEGRAAEFAARPRADRPAARARVLVAPDAAGLDAAAEVLIERLRAQRPDRLVAGADLWPHPVFGEGRLVQTAHVDDGETFAHDVYLFVHAGLRLQVEVDCPLVDLLALEDEVAVLVARLDLSATRGRDDARGVAA